MDNTRSRSARSVASFMIVVATLAILALAIAVQAIGVAEPAKAAPARQSTGPCEVVARSDAAPARIHLGESLQLSFELDVTACPPPPPRPIHIALVVDQRSGRAVEGFDFETLRGQLRDLLADLEAVEAVGVGLITYGQDASLRCPLSFEPGALLPCVDALAPAENPNPDADLANGIEAGLDLLDEARARSGTSDVDEIMVLIADGTSMDACAASRQAATQTKARGILLMTVCASAACDVPCMQDCASASRFHFALAEFDGLRRFVSRIRYETGPLAVLTALALNLDLPAGMRALPGTDDPPASSSPDGRRLQWQVAWTLRHGNRFVLRIQPTTIGNQPVAAAASVEFLDWFGRPHRVPFPIPNVEVPLPRLLLPYLLRGFDSTR